MVFPTMFNLHAHSSHLQPELLFQKLRLLVEDCEFETFYNYQTVTGSIQDTQISSLHFTDIRRSSHELDLLDLAEAFSLYGIS